jgi:hypothetical protein
MTIQNALTICCVLLLHPGCDSSQERLNKMEAHAQRGNQLFYQGDYLGAVVAYREGAKLGSVVCRRGEIYSLVMGSGGTNTNDLIRAKELARAARAKGDVETERKYLEIMDHMKLNEWKLNDVDVH